MADRTLELNIVSAKDLNNVNLITKMDVYGVVSIDGDNSQKKQKSKTPVDRSGGSNPTWNHAFRFSVSETLAHQNHLTLVVKLKCDRVLGDKDVGQVNVPVKELLDSNPPLPSGTGHGMKFVTYQVRTPSGRAKGSLTFSYRFCDSVSETGPAKSDLPVSPHPYPGKWDLPAAAYPPLQPYEYPPTPEAKPASPYPETGKSDQPMVACPAHPGGPSFLTPPPPVPGYEHTPPPQPYGYPPPDANKPGYGYPPTPEAKPVSLYPETGKSDQPMMAYPAQPGGLGFLTPPPPVPGYEHTLPPQPYGYPPQPYGYPPPEANKPGYAYPQQTPPPQSYGYAPPPTGYGYPPPSPAYGYGQTPPVAYQQPPKKNNFGLGLGAGLLGGALGGLLIGDMVSDAADMGDFGF